MGDPTERAWRLVEAEVDEKTGALTYSLDRKKLRKVRRREGRNQLRTHLTESDPATLWQYYIQLVAVDIDQAWRLSRIKGWGGGVGGGSRRRRNGGGVARARLSWSIVAASAVTSFLKVP